MKKSKYKIITDVLSMIFVLAAIVTGIMLHRVEWHMVAVNIIPLWCWHVIIGIVLIILLALHCMQHSSWFKNYSKIPAKRKRVTTIFLIIGVVVVITGIILAATGLSEIVSHIHYVTGIAFALIAVGDVIKRWKIFRALI